MRWSALSSLVVVALLFPPSVRAEAIGLGQMAPQGSPGGCNNCTLFQLQTAIASPSYVVPAGDWTIISFSMMGGPTAATGVRLRIMRPGGALFRLLAESPLESLPPGGPRTFNTSIPVTGGDLLGLRTGNPLGDAEISYLGGLDDTTGGAPGADPVLGQTIGPGGDFTLDTTGGYRLNLAASLTRPDPATNQKTATKKKKCKRKKGAAAAKKKRCKRKRRAKK